MEGDLASPLCKIQEQHPEVSIGSYLNLSKDKTGSSDPSYHTRLTIEGRDEKEVEDVAEKIMSATEGFRVSNVTLPCHCSEDC